MSLELLSAGSGIALQDAGRAGWLRYGVPRGGAMDRQAMHAANRLLGNPSASPVLEILMQGARLQVREATWAALAGTDTCPALPAWTALELKKGDVLEFSAKAGGLFAYLAVPGGFVAERWFGSVSADPRSGLGKAIKKGDTLIPAAGRSSWPMPAVARRILPLDERRYYSAKERFNLLPGPQFDAFSPAARDAFVAAEWRVSPQSDRTGYRLLGPAIAAPRSIRSEPVLPGSFQIPGNGQPIVTMVDGPTVGGYPKIAVLRDADRDRLAQCAPGTQLCFEWASF